jgi:SAM-dependent methyltransferase
MNPPAPADLPVEQTLRFVVGVIPAREARVLEVGCGRGALAAKLKARGLAVTAIDRDPEAVRITRERGVSAAAADFLDYRAAPFDAILFSRSLHHLTPLGDTLDHARSLLVPGGLVIAEEFAIENVDRETARWFFELRSVLEAAGLLPPEEGATLAASNPLERWYAEHAAEQPLHAGEDMLVGLGSRLEMVRHAEAPYLYRYLCDHLESSDRGLRVAHWVFDLETLRIAERSLRAAGLRMVARRSR